MHVFYSFPFPLGSPGIGTTALNQVRGLLGAGLRVSVVCTSTVAPVAGAEVVQTLSLAGRRIPHRAFGSPQRAYAYHDARAARLLRHRYADVDVVHVWPRGCLRTCASARRLGVPSVREVPSPHTASAFEEAAKAASAFGLVLPPEHSHHPHPDVLAREEAEYEAADGLLVPSQYAEQTFLDRGFARQRLLRTQYGFDPERFGPGDRRDGEGLTAVFLGRGEPNKGLHVALEAWLQSTAARAGRLRVCGKLWPPYTDQLSSMLRAPGVVVEGFVSDVPSLLSTADVLLLPSWTEGSALVVFEAMGSGCVPLVSQATGAPIRDGVDGLMHRVGDVTTLTSQLTSLDQDRGRLSDMRRAALARRADLSWDHAGAVLAEAYREVVSRTGTSGSSMR